MLIYQLWSIIFSALLLTIKRFFGLIVITIKQHLYRVFAELIIIFLDLMMKAN